MNNVSKTEKSDNSPSGNHQRKYSSYFRSPFTHGYQKTNLFIAKILFVGAISSMPTVLYAGVLPLFFTWMDARTHHTNETQLHSSYIERMENVLLHAALNLDPNPSKGGGDITIEDGEALRAEGGPAGTMANIEDQKASDHISIYVVRENDSIAGIAKMFGVSVNTISWANDLQGGKLKVGQVLTILPVTGVRHVVTKGDTLQSIAKKYKGDLAEITQFNDLPADAHLVVGTVVIVPDGEIGAPKKTITRSIAHDTGGPSYVGYYLRPLTGGVRSQGIHGYNGVDLAAPVGTPLLASAAGSVIVSKSGGWNGGYGNYIVIQHGNGTQTLYAHNSANIVSVGESVNQGQVIGYVGATGRATGPHVHFEIRGAKNPF